MAFDANDWQAQLARNFGFACERERQHRVDLSRSRRRTATPKPAEDRLFDFLNEVQLDHPHLSHGQVWDLAQRLNLAAFDNARAEALDAFGGPSKESDTVGRGGSWATIGDVGRSRGSLTPLPDSVALSAEIERRIKHLQSTNSKLSYSAAVEQIVKNDPELYRQYQMAVTRRAKP